MTTHTALSSSMIMTQPNFETFLAVESRTGLAQAITSMCILYTNLVHASSKFLMQTLAMLRWSWLHITRNCTSWQYNYCNSSHPTSSAYYTNSRYTLTIVEWQKCSYLLPVVFTRKYLLPITSHNTQCHCVTPWHCDYVSFHCSLSQISHMRTPWSHLDLICLCYLHLHLQALWLCMQSINLSVWSVVQRILYSYHQYPSTSIKKIL